jgi:hypothetical protein
MAGAAPRTGLSKRHLICDARGVPLAFQLTGAIRNDLQEGLSDTGGDNAPLGHWATR